MQIEISNEMLQQAGIAEHDLKIEVAVLLFEKNVFSLGKAAEFCGLHKFEMQHLLAERNIPLHYTLEMLNEDLKTIEIGS
ncbi:MAG: UPF0175 family protein [Chitinophagales bacterium]|nr:UPF0175 family protein [Chitinophagales bacterium]